MADQKYSTRGDVFDLPDMQFNSRDQKCVPHGTSEFRVYSFGYFAGERSSSFAFPVLMLQITLIIFVTRVLHFLLRPLKQPRIVCDVLAGILLSPSVLGLININYTDRSGKPNHGRLTDFLYPDQDFAVIRTVAAFGVIFYLFIVGVKIDPRALVQSRHRRRSQCIIGFSSFLLPFLVFGLSCFLLRHLLMARIARGRFLVFAVASLSITSFPVVADVLAELHLLNSELGRLALSSSMVHGLFGFLFMAAFIVINQSAARGSWSKAVWSMVSLVAVVAAVAFLFRPWMSSIVKRTPKGGKIREKHIFLIFASVIAMGVISDLIGASFVFGPFVMGLAVPDGPPLGAALVEKGQLLAGEGLMPLLFAVCGMSSNVGKLFRLWRRWVVMTAVWVAGYVLKLVGTVLPAMYCGIPMNNSVFLGLIMNFRGIVEILTLLNFKVGELLGSESYTLFLLLTILGTAVAAPLVSAFYNPLAAGYTLGRRTLQALKPHSELRIVACLQTDAPVPSLLNLLDASSPATDTPLCVYVLHLTELVGRATSALIPHKKKDGSLDPTTEMDRIHNLFLDYELTKQGQVAVQPFTSITPVKTMHHDICSLAAEKSVALIVVPFQRKDLNALALRTNVPDIQARAPCSVGILVYPDVVGVVGRASSFQFQHSIGVLFWGGPDDREALAYAWRMARRAGVSVQVFHFLSPMERREPKEQKLDDGLMARLQCESTGNEQFRVEKVLPRDVEETIRAIKSIRGGYNLLLVGRKQGANSLLDQSFEEWSETPELGVVGDMLASKDCEGSSASILVLQQQA